MNTDNRIIGEYGAVGAIRIRRGNQSTWRKHASMLFCQFHISHDLNWD
jgi:hypothetical protein